MLAGKGTNKCRDENGAIIHFGLSVWKLALGSQIRIGNWQRGTAALLDFIRAGAATF
jgi:hypothetical protein